MLICRILIYWLFDAVHCKGTLKRLYQGRKENVETHSLNSLRQKNTHARKSCVWLRNPTNAQNKCIAVYKSLPYEPPRVVSYALRLNLLMLSVLHNINQRSFTIRYSKRKVTVLSDFCLRSVRKTWFSPPTTISTHLFRLDLIQQYQDAHSEANSRFFWGLVNLVNDGMAVECVVISGLVDMHNVTCDGWNNK